MTFEAVIRVDRKVEIGRIDPKIYGHFLESSFFSNIEGGVFDEGSPLSRPGPGPLEGVREDVLELCRELGLPIVRWPGGNFTSGYHWEDGIGPRDNRPRRLELAWGVEESNRFGTDEFLAWCAEVGTEPYLAHSARDVDEAVRWVEYTNYAGGTEYTRRRAANGHPAPYGVRYWGIGNEVYGPWQMGYRSAEQYAAAAREHARFMRQVDPSIELVAVGIPWSQEQWTQAVLAQVGHLVDFVSLHLYAASTHLYTTAAGDDDYEAVVAQAIFFEQQIQDYAHLVADLAAKQLVDRPLALALDEWTIRHYEPKAWPEPEPSADGGVVAREVSDVDRDGPLRLRVNRYSPRTLSDALLYAGVFHALHRTVGLDVPVRMANTINLVNANGVIVARPDGAVRAATYHVWDLYQNRMGTIAVATGVEGPSYSAAVRQGTTHDGSDNFTTRPATVPYLDVSATLTEDRHSLRLAVINRHRDTAITARLVFGRDGERPRRAHVHDVGADVDEVLATNRIGDSDRIALRDRGEVDVAAGGYTFAPHSVTVLSVPL